jgi:transposase-like protein
MTDYQLSDHERAVLVDFRDHGESAEARRAQIILLSAEGSPAAHIATVTALSTAQVYHWRREWKKQRLQIFPDQIPVDTPAAEVEAKPRPGVDGPRLPLELRPTVGMLPDDAMAEAARKALLFNFERMLRHEPGVRLGENIEAVHDMRVATRRMRSAFRLFKPFFKSNAIKPYVHGLRDTAAALGDVRDLDVFMEKAQVYRQNHPDVDLSLLFQVWENRLDKARRV